MFNWFYNWLDPKILRLEKWVNRKVITKDMIDLDLDKVKAGEQQENHMYRQPPGDGSWGPFIINLQGGEILEYMVGTHEFEAFALIKKDNKLFWRHRDGGSTEDFHKVAFDSMKDFFCYIDSEPTKFWDCQLRTKALENAQP